MSTTRGGKQRSSTSIKTVDGMTARHARNHKAYKAREGRYGGDPARTRVPVCPPNCPHQAQ